MCNTAEEPVTPVSQVILLTHMRTSSSSATPNVVSITFSVAMRKNESVCLMYILSTIELNLVRRFFLSSGVFSLVTVYPH